MGLEDTIGIYAFQTPRNNALFIYVLTHQYTFFFHWPIHRSHTSGEQNWKRVSIFKNKNWKWVTFIPKPRKCGIAGPISVRSCLSIGTERKGTVQMLYSPCETIYAWDPTRWPLTIALSMVYRRNNPSKGIASFTVLTFPSAVTRDAFILLIFS